MEAVDLAWDSQTYALDLEAALREISETTHYNDCTSEDCCLCASRIATKALQGNEGEA